MSKTTVEYVKIPDEITLISEDHHYEKYSGDDGGTVSAAVVNNTTIFSIFGLLTTLAVDAFIPFAAAGNIITVMTFSSIISFILLGIMTGVSLMENDNFLLENFIRSIKNRRGNKTSLTMSSSLHIRHASSVWANPVLAVLNPFRFIKPTTLAQNVYYDVKSDIYSRETNRLGFVRISTKVEKFGGPRYAFVKAIDALEESR